MKTWKFIRFILFSGIAISIFFLVDFYLANFKFFLGTLMCLYAFDKILQAFLGEEEVLKSPELYNGLVEGILGLAALFFFNITDHEHLCIIWGVWSILREAKELEEEVKMMVEHKPALISAFESLIVMTLSITLISDPGMHHATIHMYVLVVELISTVLFPHMQRFVVIIKQRHKQKKAE